MPFVANGIAPPLPWMHSSGVRLASVSATKAQYRQCNLHQQVNKMPLKNGKLPPKKLLTCCRESFIILYVVFLITFILYKKYDFRSIIHNKPALLPPQRAILSNNPYHAGIPVAFRRRSFAHRRIFCFFRMCHKQGNRPPLRLHAFSVFTAEMTTRPFAPFFCTQTDFLFFVYAAEAPQLSAGSPAPEPSAVPFCNPLPPSAAASASAPQSPLSGTPPRHLIPHHAGDPTQSRRLPPHPNPPRASIHTIQ